MTENSAEQENAVQAPVMVNADTAKTDLQPGEKGFTIVLLAFCAFLLYRSILLWQQAPGINGPAIVPVLAPDEEGDYPLYRLVVERVTSINTAAAGGNASLMTLEA